MPQNQPFSSSELLSFVAIMNVMSQRRMSSNYDIYTPVIYSDKSYKYWSVLAYAESFIIDDHNSSQLHY